MSARREGLCSLLVTAEKRSVWNGATCKHTFFDLEIFIFKEKRRFEIVVTLFYADSFPFRTWFLVEKNYFNPIPNQAHQSAPYLKKREIWNFYEVKFGRTLQTTFSLWPQMFHFDTYPYHSSQGAFSWRCSLLISFLRRDSITIIFVYLI